MGNVSSTQLSNGAAWGLVAGTLFFSIFGIHTGKDVFLMIGLVACALGDAAFVALLLEQEGLEALATVYGLLAALSCYAAWRQLLLWREEGCGSGEDEDEEDAEPGAALAGPLTPPLTPAQPGVVAAPATPALSDVPLPAAPVSPLSISGKDGVRNRGKGGKLAASAQ